MFLGVLILRARRSRCWFLRATNGGGASNIARSLKAAYGKVYRLVSVKMCRRALAFNRWCSGRWWKPFVRVFATREQGANSEVVMRGAEDRRKGHAHEKERGRGAETLSSF